MSESNLCSMISSIVFQCRCFRAGLRRSVMVGTCGKREKGREGGRKRGREGGGGNGVIEGGRLRGKRRDRVGQRQRVRE